ncbi:MAG: outer membrane beta-barrel protein [Pseudomonadaceae bacterium]|nr:outer membrane beta-barrel protein [Pseudomonadaceae bacterium]
MKSTVAKSMSKPARMLGAMLVAGLTIASTSAFAVEKGDIMVRAGFHNVDPKSDNGRVNELAADIDVDDDTQLTFDLTYMFTDNWGLEVLAALPFEHDLKIGGADAGSVKHLPPTISALYYFNPQSTVQFYAGVGVNVTIFFEEDERGPLAGTELELDTSVGPAVVLGIDIPLNDKWFLNADVRYFDIDTEATVTAPGLRLTPDVEIDPFAFGLNVGYRF